MGSILKLALDRSCVPVHSEKEELQSRFRIWGFYPMKYHGTNLAASANRLGVQVQYSCEYLEREFSFLLFSFLLTIVP